MWFVELLFILLYCCLMLCLNCVWMLFDLDGALRFLLVVYALVLIVLRYCVWFSFSLLGCAAFCL